MAIWTWTRARKCIRSAVPAGAAAGTHAVHHRHGRRGCRDSSGLGVLVRCYRDARSRGEVALQNVRKPIERILEFTRLDSIFRILPLAVVVAADGAADDPTANVHLRAA